VISGHGRSALPNVPGNRRAQRGRQRAPARRARPR
jgi:hypothetical protein